MSTDFVSQAQHTVARVKVVGVNSDLGTALPGDGDIFSRAEALQLGESDRSLLAALRSKLIVRLRRGWYVNAAAYARHDDVGKHLLLARAVLADQRGRTALTGISAAALHGFALYGHDLGTVHIVRLDGGASRNQAAVNHHRVSHDIERDIGLYGGILATSPARTVWEVACRSTREGGTVTADSALHQDPGLIESVRDMAACFASVPGSRVARLALRLADPRAESPGESLARVAFQRHGIPAPELQYRVLDVNGVLIGVADFYWEDYRHLGEFDGKVKYESMLRDGETVADCVFREKRREDAMRAGFRGMTRFTWSEIMPSRVSYTMSRLREALEQSRRLYTRLAG